MAERCIFCDREFLRSTAEARMRRDRPDRAPGLPLRLHAGAAAATRGLLLAAKAEWDERLSPGGYTLI